ncbi:Adenylate cyclase [Chlorella vulgaris]
MAALPEQNRSKKPMYEDEHASCSVLLAKIRNEGHLLRLPPHDQFRWLHRFYLVLDRIAEQHRVYKLYGGPHGFMISTGVAEPDADHATTLLRFSLHLLQAAQSIRVTGTAPLDMVMVLASGAATSGLLGTTSLTYQIVGKAVSVAREVMETQLEVPFIVLSGMCDELKPEVAAELAPLGSVPLRCCPGEQEALFSLPRYAAMRLTQPLAASSQQPAMTAAPGTGAGQLGPAAPGNGNPLQTPESANSPGVLFGDAGCSTAGAAGAPPVALLDSFEAAAADRLLRTPQAGSRHLQNATGAISVPYNQASSEMLMESDLLLRFEDPELESAFARYNGESQCLGEMAWLALTLVSAALYGLAWGGPGLLPSSIAQFQLLPMLGALLCHYKRDTFRELLWFVQRLLVLVCHSLPGSFVFTQPGIAPWFAFGLCNLAVEVLARRLRLHLQLLSSLLIYATTLSLMSLHPEGSPGRALINPSYLALHLCVTVVAPVVVAACCDIVARRRFQAQLQERDASPPPPAPQPAPLQVKKRQ